MSSNLESGGKSLMQRIGRTVLTGAGIGLCFWIVMISTWSPQFWAVWWGVGIVAGLITATFVIVRWTNWIRGLVQFGVFLFAEVVYLCSGTLCGQCPLSFGACPAGTIHRLAFMPEFAWYWTLAAVVATGATLGTFVCGWICPVGFVQDLVNSLKLRHLALPRRVNLVRWLTLAATIVLVPMELRWKLLSKWGLLVFSEPAIITFVVVLMLSLIVVRPFCRMVCPFGLLYGRLHRLSPVKIKFDAAACHRCGRCDAVCISGIQPVTEVNGALCAKCGDCRSMSRQQKCAERNRPS